MLDLLITHANLPDGRKDMSVAVRDGRIVEVAPRIEAQAAVTIDAGGMLLAPHFVDPHFHMDATLSYGLPRVNQSGTLLAVMFSNSMNSAYWGRNTFLA